MFPNGYIALAKYADSNKSNLNLLEAVIKINNEIRKKYLELSKEKHSKIYLSMIKSDLLPRW